MEQEKMDQEAAQLLEIVANVCAKSTMRPIDWQHLYAFTLYVHGKGLTVHAPIVREALIAQGCSRQKAGWLSTQYHHFAGLLALYDHRKSTKHL